MRKYEDLKYAEELYETEKTKIYNYSEQNISRLVTELESGGNIRFEEGKSQDKWYASVVDLIKSRFNPDSIPGIKGISVSRVLRVHNRYSRSKFEDKLE